MISPQSATAGAAWVPLRKGLRPDFVWGAMHELLGTFERGAGRIKAHAKQAAP